MTFEFEPSASLLIIAAAIGIAAFVVVFLTGRHPARKALTIVFAAILVPLLLIRHRTGLLTIDDSGIGADTYGRPSIQWSDIDNATYVSKLTGSEYQPVPSRRNIIRAFGYGKARYGWFGLANGERALVAVQRSDGAAVVIVTDDTTYLFAPSDVIGFAEAVADHVPVSGLENI